MASPDASQNYTGSLDEKDFALHGHHTVLLLTVLCILLLFTLFFLYINWTCYNHRLSTSTAATTTVATTTERATHAPEGLDADTISRIPVELHRKGEKRECAICLAVFTEGEKVKVLWSCSHEFHPECIDAWLRTQPSCPLCRAFVVEKPVTDVRDMV